MNVQKSLVSSLLRGRCRSAGLQFPALTIGTMRSRLNHGSRLGARLPAIRQFASSTSVKVVVVDNPYTGETYAEVPLSSQEEASAIVARSAAAQVEWKRTSLEERIELCNRFMDAFEQDREQVERDITGQMGKPLSFSSGEVNGMYERTKAMIELAPQALADDMLPDKPNFARKIVKEPVGVVLVIAPWNYPLMTAVNCIVPAILAGNSVVIKHSGRTPLCAEAFARAFESAGAPAGLVQYLHCDHATIDAVIGHDAVGFVSFTGSVGGGHQIYKSIASSRFIDATLELGGKDPAYVASDADMAAAIGGLVDGAFFNAGQSCCGIERVYVHRSKYDEFVAGAAEALGAYRLGDPMDPDTNMGPLAQKNSADFLKSQVDEAVSKGARLIVGGKPTTDSAGLGRFFEPTLVVDCDHTMGLMMEESFGPVLGVMAVDSDEEAIKLMNDSPYGLSACIYTSDQQRAEHFAKEVSTGTFFMNRCDYLDPLLPWTGVRDTGKGYSLSVHGFRGVTQLKSIHLKLDPNL